MKPYGMPFCTICYLGRISLWPSQTDIGWVWDPKSHYHLDLTNAMPIQVQSRPTCAQRREAWLDVHLDKLVAKGVIGPILLGEQPCNVLRHCS